MSTQKDYSRFQHQHQQHGAALEVTSLTQEHVTPGVDSCIGKVGLQYSTAQNTHTHKQDKLERTGVKMEAGLHQCDFRLSDKGLMRERCPHTRMLKKTKQKKTRFLKPLTATRTLISSFNSPKPECIWSETHKRECSVYDSR